MVKVGVVGATGYTGMELIRILLGHPGVELSYAASRSSAGRRLSEALPHLGKGYDLALEAFDARAAASRASLLFLCLPHGQSVQAAAALLEADAKVVDLSADFRIRDPRVYAQWYQDHPRPDLLADAIYGMPEAYREKIRGSRLVANPGCYPTSILLAALPLLETHMAAAEGIIADSKSGVSGAGREPKPNLHFPEVEGNFSAYSVAGRHRHTCEIEQELSLAARKDVRVTFTPHLLPVSRGILTTLYAQPGPGASEEVLCELFARRYAGEPFVQVRTANEPLPDIKSVAGTNLCVLAPRFDRRAGRILVISCIDNLVKGAAGQAVQNMNIMLGMDEAAGLRALPIVP